MEIRPIPRFEDFGASADGRIWRIIQSNKTKIVPREITQRPANGGYFRVTLWTRGLLHTHLVHRLVLSAFTGVSLSDKRNAAHRDGDRRNNNPANLYWATNKENAADSIRHGTSSRGSKHPRAVLSEGDVEWIRAYPKSPGMFSRMAERLQVHRNIIISAYRRGTWKHVA